MGKPDLKKLANLLPDATYTLEEAATMCGMTSAGLKKWHDKGELTLIRIGSRYYVTGAELKKAVKL